MKRFTFMLVVLLFAGKSFSQSKERPYVLLISFDGFRYDYANQFDAPNFKSIIHQGAQAEGLIPSFPSKTFPNHYTIVTGLYPGNHGLVDNNFYDPERKEYYEMKNRKRVTDPYYYRGVPLWKLARENGIKSASMFWIGSELLRKDMGPEYHFQYEESLPDTVRIQQIFKWLKLPRGERPNFLTLYFSSPDHEGHLYGPAAEETKQAVLRADRNLGLIMKGLREINLPVNVIIVSDHGMEELKTNPDSYVFLDELLNLKDPTVRVTNGGTQAHIYISHKGQVDSLFHTFKQGSKKYAVFRQQDFPEHWHYKTSRSGDLLITAAPGYYLVTTERNTFLTQLRPGRITGVHGYDPNAAYNMRGIFYAFGPNIKANVTIPAFQNIHIYPFMAEILGLPLPAIDGNAEVLKPILVR
jgi:predicted AlkP superfamily pyrophosphatase or phosphodiesterase